MNFKSLLGTFFLCLLLSLQASATIIYVDSAHVAGTQTGISWSTAFSNFQSGINAANSGDSVWVAKGTYTPPLASSFNMKEGVKIYGGFTNTNTQFTDRNWQAGLSVLKSSDVWLIVNSVNNLTSNAVLDGFKILGYSTSLPTGAIFNKQSSPAIVNCSFSNFSGSAGAAIYNRQCAPVITNCTFSNNSATYTSSSDDNGGAIYNVAASPVISYCTFNGNLAGLDGGAIFNTDTAAPSIYACTFSNNSAVGGGAIYNEGTATINITNCNFQNNASGSGVTAGGIDNYGTGDLRLKGCTFSGNINGAVFNNGGAYCVIDSCFFTGNTANGAFTSDGIFTLTNSTFTGNLNSAIVVRDSFYIDKCSFLSNIGNSGGAIQCTYPSSLNATIKNSSFRGNHLAQPWQNGGAIAINTYNSDTTKSIVIVNCLFSGNYSTYGGAINLSNASVKIKNCTIAGNRTPNYTGDVGVTIGMSNSFCKVDNTIIWDNQTGIASDASSSVRITYSLVQGLTPLANSHNITGSPLFANSPNYFNAPFIDGDYTLQSSSPCINAGINDSLPSYDTIDNAGNHRINNTTVDMGAYEFSTTPLAIDLLSFTGRIQKNNNILLQWQMAKEADTNFELEHSEDGSTFTSIYTGKTANGSNNSFSYVDVTPDATNYYRLKLNPRIGEAAYSNIIVFNQMPVQDFINLYPNPTKDNITLVGLHASLLGTMAILADVSGKEIKKVKLINSNQSILLSDINVGIYFLGLADGSNIKIIKQ
jgi:predicted outer membrane repeat protein